MTILKSKLKELLIPLSKMDIINKKNRRQYLSVPALNKINNEVYIEGNRCLSDNNSGSSHSMKFTSDKIKKNERRKSFMSFFVSGSSTDDKTELSSFKFLDLDIGQTTWNSSVLTVHNDQTEFCNFSSSRKNDRQINESTLSMTQAHFVSRGPTDPDGSAGAPLTTKNVETSELIQSSRSSKARQKKFHRHFKQVDIEEKVLNYYSCALVGDILLQGHLYITENFFAFYSNVFGYVTKLLIPTVDVLKISKEKTAKIIPNAVGISTEDEKHVFGSLLSRDSTYKFMLQVWKAANNTATANVNSPPVNVISRLHLATKPALPRHPNVIKTEMPSDEDSSASSGNEDPSYISNFTSPASSDNLPQLLPSVARQSILLTKIEAQSSERRWNFFKIKTVLVISLTVLIFLLGSAGFLVYKIVVIQNHFNDLSISPGGSDMYENIIKWQSMVHSKSADKISEFLNINLNQIIKVRLSLEALSTLILSGNNNNNINVEKSHSNSKWESTIVKHGSEETKVEENNLSSK